MHNYDICVESNGSVFHLRCMLALFLRLRALGQSIMQITKN